MVLDGALFLILKVSRVMELGKLLVCLLICCLLPAASAQCFNGTLELKEFDEMKEKGCTNAGETLHVQQDSEFKLHVVCSPVFTCAKGTYAYVDVEKCRVLCKICQEDRFQPEEENTDKFVQPYCANKKNRCNQDTKMTCQPSSPERDDTCQCDWRKGYRPLNDSCRLGCYTESDKNCGHCEKDSACKEGEELNATYHCIPSMVKPNAASSASQNLNGSSTSAPGVNSVTTPETQKSTSSPTSSTKIADMRTVSDSEEPRDHDDTWEKVGGVFIFLFIACIIIIIIIIIIIGKILWKRRKSEKGLCCLFPQQSPNLQDADIPMMPTETQIAELTQRIENLELERAELTQRIENLELEREAYKALLKEKHESLIKLCDCIKSVKDAGHLKKEMMIVDMPDEVEESAREAKQQVSRKYPHKSKYKHKTSREPASEDEVESLMSEVTRGKKMEGQVSSPGFENLVPSALPYTEASSVMVNVTDELPTPAYMGADHPGLTTAVLAVSRQQEPEGAVGGADNQEQSSTLGLSSSWNGTQFGKSYKTDLP